VKWSTEQPPSQILNLTSLEHGFPFGLSLDPIDISKLSFLLPLLRSITLVTSDSSVQLLTTFPNLSSITVELEDCLGEGFIKLLSNVGSRLLELSLSCSSDPGVGVDEPSQQGQLINAGLIGAGLLAPNLLKLHISGCGLVSQTAVSSLKLQERLADASWLRRSNAGWFSSLKSLILTSYEEDISNNFVNSNLLKNILISAKDLEILNLEGSFGLYFTDNYLSSILAVNRFERLRILDICVSEEGMMPGRIPLSCNIVRHILHTCNSIKELRMSDWNISNQEFVDLEKLIEENNWDLLATRRIRRTDNI